MAVFISKDDAPPQTSRIAHPSPPSYTRPSSADLICVASVTNSITGPLTTSKAVELKKYQAVQKSEMESLRLALRSSQRNVQSMNAQAAKDLAKKCFIINAATKLSFKEMKADLNADLCQFYEVAVASMCSLFIDQKFSAVISTATYAFSMIKTSLDE